MKIKTGSLLVLVALASLAQEAVSYDEVELIFHYEPGVEAVEASDGVDAVDGTDGVWQLRVNNLTQGRTGTVSATEEEFAALTSLLHESAHDEDTAYNDYESLESKLITEAGGETYLLPLELRDV